LLRQVSFTPPARRASAHISAEKGRAGYSPRYSSACAEHRSYSEEDFSDLGLRKSLSPASDAVIKRSLQSARPDPQVASELLQVAKDIYLRFADKLVLSPGLQESSLDSLISILSSSRNASIRKRATEAIPALVATNPGLFSAKFKDQLEQGIASGGEAGNAWVGLVAALAKEQGVVAGIGGLVGSGRILDEILKHTSDPEQVEATEAAFVVRALSVDQVLLTTGYRDADISLPYRNQAIREACFATVARARQIRPCTYCFDTHQRLLTPELR